MKEELLMIGVTLEALAVVAVVVVELTIKVLVRLPTGAVHLGAAAVATP